MYCSTSDDNGVSLSSIAFVEILNTSPTVDTAEITPNTTVEANTEITCSGTGSDIDAEDVTTSPIVGQIAHKIQT